MWVWVSMSQDSPHPLHSEGFNQTARMLLMKFLFSHENIVLESVSHSPTQSNHRGYFFTEKMSPSCAQFFSSKFAENRSTIRKTTELPKKG